MKTNSLNLPKSVHIWDETVGEGLQGEEHFIPTGAKVFLVERLIDAGFKHIAVCSFAHPGLIPQFSDVEEVYRRIPRKSDVAYYSPTANMRALQRAIELKEKEGVGPAWVGLPIATSDAYCEWMFNKTAEDQWPFIKEGTKVAHDAGLKVIACLVCIWACPWLGTKMPIKKGIEFTDRLFAHGVDVVGHGQGSKTGLNSPGPTEVYEYFRRVLEKNPDPSVHSFHLHDNISFGLANFLAAMQAGITQFETSMGGLSGMPKLIVDGVPVRGAVDPPEEILNPPRGGLVPTEDMVAMCSSMGIETGVDVTKALKVGRWVEKMVGRTLMSGCVRVK
jgi:hydroxymethylglutaryl-CoA lyase